VYDAGNIAYRYTVHAPSLRPVLGRALCLPRS
jgi:hypothetical protein